MAKSFSSIKWALIELIVFLPLWISWFQLQLASAWQS